MFARCELINWTAGCAYSVLLNAVNNADSAMYKVITPLDNAAVRDALDRGQQQSCAATPNNHLLKR